MNLALFGYGKMGKAIEEIAHKNGHDIVLVVAKDTDLNQLELSPLKIDVAIEFSTPESSFENVRFCLEHNIPVVCGTTGWSEKIPEIEKLTNQHDGTFFYASNFSIGVNLFFKLNKELAKLLTEHSYKSKIEEIHHIHKKDSPSGTAITLADDIINLSPTLTHWVEKVSDESTELPIISIREGEVPGTHRIIYSGKHDEISIEHKALSRLGFAEGVVAVVEWIDGRSGVLGMEDYLDQ
jgi:4-hydroxy-tetrahydrodipicolinate reductase